MFTRKKALKVIVLPSEIKYEERAEKIYIIIDSVCLACFLSIAFSSFEKKRSRTAKLQAVSSSKNSCFVLDNSNCIKKKSDMKGRR